MSEGFMDRLSDMQPDPDESFVPQTWDQWWDSVCALAQYGVDPYDVDPPLHILATGPRPGYTLPDDYFEDGEG